VERRFHVKTYKVVGTTSIDADGPHVPGDVFEADIAPTVEAFLTQIGAIVEVAPPVPDVPVPEPEPVVASSRRLFRKKEEE
jgi:hypothetical protein